MSFSRGAFERDQKRFRRWSDENLKAARLEKQGRTRQALNVYLRLADEGADTPGTYQRMAILGERHHEWRIALRGSVWLALASHRNGHRDDREVRRIARIHRKSDADEQPIWHVSRRSDSKRYGPYSRADIATFVVDRLVELTDTVQDQDGTSTISVAELLQDLASN